MALINTPPGGSSVDMFDPKTKELKVTGVWLNFFNQIFKFINASTQYGPTAQRPTTGLWIGRFYYDTTLGYGVRVHQVNPTVIWHNEAGATV
jgi:hypothetical protein